MLLEAVTQHPAPRPLVVGGDGLIGNALVNELSAAQQQPFSTTRRADLVSPARPFLDLRSGAESWEPPAPVSTAYFCAAATAIDECRRDPAGTATINVDAPVEIATRLHGTGAHIIVLSTNLVFDGAKPLATPADAPNPQTEYGRQKLRMEQAICRLGERITILRLTKVLGPQPPLLAGWSRALKEGAVIRPFADVVIAPVPLSLVVDALTLVGRRKVFGIVHISGATDVSYAEIAGRLAKHAGARPDQVQPITARSTNPSVVVAPQHTCLDSTRMKRDLDLNPPEWQSVIDHVV